MYNILAICVTAIVYNTIDVVDYKRNKCSWNNSVITGK